MYVAVKGGERAIASAHALLARDRRGDPALPAITPRQVREQMALAVDRVMAEGALYDPDLAASAILQARGDLIEAIFLVRAYRTTLPRLAVSEPVDTGAMQVERRVSATFKDIPGGQILGPTFDYTHRLIEPLDDAPSGETATGVDAEPAAATPRVTDVLGAGGLLEGDPEPASEPSDITRTPLTFPADRSARLQALSRGDEGFLLSLAYSTQRGYGRTHPFVGELRIGAVEVEVMVPELGHAVPVGTLSVTECQMVNQFKGSAETPPQFTRGYGLVFGKVERKAMAMALVDRSLRAAELGEPVNAPAQDQEFVIAHADNVQATGFVEHLKLPHYVDFQAELVLLHQLREEHAASAPAASGPAEAAAAE